MDFNASVTFLLLVLEILKKYHKGDFAGHCPKYIHIYKLSTNELNDVQCLKSFLSSRKIIKDRGISV